MPKTVAERVKRGQKATGMTIDPKVDAEFRLFLSKQNVKRVQSGQNALNFSQACERALAHLVKTGTLLNSET